MLDISPNVVFLVFWGWFHCLVHYILYSSFLLIRSYIFPKHDKIAYKCWGSTTICCTLFLARLGDLDCWTANVHILIRDAYSLGRMVVRERIYLTAYNWLGIPFYFILFVLYFFFLFFLILSFSFFLILSFPWFFFCKWWHSVAETKSRSL